MYMLYICNVIILRCYFIIVFLLTAQKLHLYHYLKNILIENKFIEREEPKLLITEISQDNNILEIIDPNMRNMLEISYISNEIQKLYKTKKEVKRDWTKVASKEYFDVLLEMFFYDYGNLSFEYTIFDGNNNNQSNNLNKEQMQERKIEIINLISKWKGNREQLLRNDFIAELLVTVKIWKTNMLP